MKLIKNITVGVVLLMAVPIFCVLGLLVLVTLLEKEYMRYFYNVILELKD